MNTPSDSAQTQLLDAIVMHVPFDGWTKPAFDMAVADTGMSPEMAKIICPRSPKTFALRARAQIPTVLSAANRGTMLRS